MYGCCWSYFSPIACGVLHTLCPVQGCFLSVFSLHFVSARRLQNEPKFIAVCAITHLQACISSLQRSRDFNKKNSAVILQQLYCTAHCRTDNFAFAPFLCLSLLLLFFHSPSSKSALLRTLVVGSSVFWSTVCCCCCCCWLACHLLLIYDPNRASVL